MDRALLALKDFNEYLRASLVKKAEIDRDVEKSRVATLATVATELSDATGVPWTGHTNPLRVITEVADPRLESPFRVMVELHGEASATVRADAVYRHQLISVCPRAWEGIEVAKIPELLPEVVGRVRHALPDVIVRLSELNPKIVDIVRDAVIRRMGLDPWTVPNVHWNPTGAPEDAALPLYLAVAFDATKAIPAGCGLIYPPPALKHLDEEVALAATLRMCRKA